MLIHQTIEKAIVLKLHGIARWLEHQRSSASVQELSFDEKVSLMIDAESEDRDQRRLTRLLKAAKLKHDACPENIDYRASRQLDRQVMSNLSQVNKSDLTCRSSWRLAR